jgi:hypothetical protein
LQVRCTAGYRFCHRPLSRRKEKKLRILQVPPDLLGVNFSLFCSDLNIGDFSRIAFLVIQMQKKGDFLLCTDRIGKFIDQKRKKWFLRPEQGYLHFVKRYNTLKMPLLRFCYLHCTIAFGHDDQLLLPGIRYGYHIPYISFYQQAGGLVAKGRKAAFAIALQQQAF